MRKTAFLFLLLVSATRLMAQGTFSGEMMMNLNFFNRDTNIKASGNPLYDNALSGSEGWLSMRYNIKGFTFFVRADAFNNSNLEQPAAASTDFGIGAWSINKEMKDLSITVGTIYDQVGSGLLFRAYEDRGLLIDNGLVGIELKYKLSPNIWIKGFTGQQRNNTAIGTDQALHTPPYGPVIKGLNAEGDFSVGKLHLIPGAGFLNRTLDQTSYSTIQSTILSEYSNNQASGFTPVYNMYAGSLYNTLTYKNFSWYMEGAYKSHEAIVDPFTNLLIDKPGNAEYTSINFGKKGIALSLTGKRSDDYVMRVSPTVASATSGMLNWQPIVAVLRPERLLSRYTPPSYDFSEQAGTANLLLSPNDVTNFAVTYSNSNTLNNVRLYQEVYAEGYTQCVKNWIMQFGAQYLEYNISLYQNRANLGAPIVYAVTPFTELTYRLTEKKSLRAELQYMVTKQDYGSWVFALIEYDIAPRWSLSASDMFNTVINRNADNPDYNDAGFSTKKANNYYNLYVSYSKAANRFSLAYVKQVDGYNCSGGVCRYEPAFSGVKATITSSF